MDGASIFALYSTSINVNYTTIKQITVAMLKTNLKIALRQVLKHGIYSTVNIIGLSVSLSICILLGSYVRYETSYNSGFNQGENIYQVNTTLYSLNMEAYTGHDLAPLLRQSLPGIRNFVRTHWVEAKLLRKSGNEVVRYNASGLNFVDSSFFEVFDIGAESAQLRHSLDAPYSIVLTRELAAKLFANPDDAVGQTITMKGEWLDADLNVTGILNDWPKNSSFQFSGLVTIDPLIRSQFYQDDPHWNNFFTFVQFDDKQTAERATSAFPTVARQYTQGQPLTYEPEVYFEPLPDIHLSKPDPRQGQDLDSLYIFGALAIIILVIAWVNYINLSTARAMDRAREVGIRKAIGVMKGELITQFLVESFLINVLSLGLAIAISIGLLPMAAELIGQPFELRLTTLPQLLVLAFLLVIGTLASGLYPAFVLSSFRTADVIKGTIGSSVAGFSLRKALIVFQFGVSLCLLVFTMAILGQVDFMEKQDKGLTTDHVIVINGLDDATGNMEERAISFKNELSALPGVEHVSTSGTVPGGSYNWETHMEIAGQSKETIIAGENARVIFTDRDFIDTYRISLVAGHEWNPLSKVDLNKVLINEATIGSFDLKSAEHAVGEKVVFGRDTMEIIGVVKNFYWESLKVTHHPTIIRPVNIHFRRMSVRASGDVNKILKPTEALFKRHFPEATFDYYFAEDYYNRMYKSDTRFGQSVLLFAGFAVVIACMGLFALATFTVNQRSREISIRKVLGASATNIMALLTGQFGKLLIVATVLGVPCSWWVINGWLARYPVRMGLSLMLFLVPVIVLAMVAGLSLIVQVYRAAIVNPATTLRR